MITMVMRMTTMVVILITMVVVVTIMIVLVTIVVVTVSMVVVIIFVTMKVPMAAVVFAITIILSPKVTVVKVTSPVTMPVAVPVLLVSLPVVVVAGFGVLVSQPQVGIELVVKLVVVGLVRIELVQILAGLLAEADDRRTVRAVGELASSRCRVVLDVQSEVLLSPLGQKSCHQVVEALGVMHADTEVFFLFVVLVLLAPTLFILLAPPIVLV